MDKEWMPLGAFADTLGAAEAEKAFSALEARATAEAPVTLGMLRGMHGLLTPNARIRAAMELLDPALGPKNFKGRMTALAHEQWVEFHWSRENPLLDAAKGI